MCDSLVFDLERAQREVTERILARLTPEQLAGLEELDHGDRSHYVQLDWNEQLAAANARLLARLTPEQLAGLEELDHGDRSHYVPFDLDEAIRRRNRSF